MSEDRKIISIGDYIAKRDTIITISISDPENPDKLVDIKLRVKKPSPSDSISFVEFISNMSKLHNITGSSDDISSLPPEQRAEVFQLSYEYDAMKIVASIFYPPENDDLSIETQKVFSSVEDVMSRCTEELFEKLRFVVSSHKLTLTEGEAKK